MGKQKEQLSQNIFKAMFFSIMYEGRVFGDTTIHLMALLRRNGYFRETLDHFGPYWTILGHSEPHVGTQNFRNVLPCIISSHMGFSQQLTVGHI